MSNKDPGGESANAAGKQTPLSTEAAPGGDPAPPPVNGSKQALTAVQRAMLDTHELRLVLMQPVTTADVDLAITMGIPITFDQTKVDKGTIGCSRCKRRIDQCLTVRCGS